MPGPAPKRFSTRSIKRVPGNEWRTLPAEGRKGPAPEWPLAKRPEAAEKKLWESLWATPQAVAWEEEVSWTRVVARYVRVLLLCEDPATMTGALLAEARMIEDRLGLNAMSLKKNRWVIGKPGGQSIDEPVKVVTLDDYRAL